jgi:hypothetical protein
MTSKPVPWEQQTTLDKAHLATLSEVLRESKPKDEHVKSNLRKRRKQQTLPLPILIRVSLKNCGRPKTSVVIFEISVEIHTGRGKDICATKALLKSECRQAGPWALTWSLYLSDLNVDGNGSIVRSYVLSRVRVCDYRQGMEWWMDLLTTCTHQSQLQ